MKKNTVEAKANMLRVGARKLNSVARLIYGMRVEDAKLQLMFLNKRETAIKVKKCLDSAIANAENNYGINIDQLFVSCVTVGPAISLKRFMARGRGRSSSIRKEFSNLRIILEERD
jgi:large subunit ribosomal protein L22